jgi:hypothetical protein
MFGWDVAVKKKVLWAMISKKSGGEKIKIIW